MNFRPGAAPTMVSPIAGLSGVIPTPLSPVVQKGPAAVAALAAPGLPKSSISVAPVKTTSDAQTPLEKMVSALQAPSPIDELPKQASGDSIQGAAREDFALRLGEKPASVSAVAAEAFTTLEGPSGLAPSAVAKSVKANAVERPQARSAAFPATVSGVSAVVAGAFLAAAHAVPILAAGVVAFSAASAVAAVRAATEFISFKSAIKRGKGTTDKRFKDYVRGRVMEGTLDAGTAELLKIDRPEKTGFWDSRFAYTLGGSIYIRPELIATPALFDKVLAHELEHLRGPKARAPPGLGILGRIASRAVSETRARLSEFNAAATLEKLRIPVLERALKLSQNSLRFKEPYDVLVVNPTSAELEDPSLYRGLSGGNARLETLRSQTPHEALGDIKNAGRFRAVVLAKPQELLPVEGSAERRNFDWSLQKLDEIYREASRLMARGIGQEGAEKAGLKRYGDLAKAVAQIPAGDRQAIEKFDKIVRDFWRQIAGPKVAGLGVTKLVEGLYDGMKDKGIAFLQFGPQDRGVAGWEKMLRFWEAKDGGRFRVKRVDLENGGHIIVLRKAEARVGLWLRPAKHEVFERSIPDASGSPENRAAARQALEKAGLKDYLEKFDSMQVEVRAMYGADVGRQEIYVTIPRRFASALAGVIADPVVQIGSARSDFQSHLMDSAGLQNVLPVWKMGITGKGGTVMLIGTGGDTTHEDFAGRLDVIDEVGEGPEDWIGHETHTAGIAVSGNGSFMGMAREAWAIIGKVFRKDHPGAGDGEIKSAAMAGWERADVINLSLGSRGSSSDDLAVFLSDLTLKPNSRGEHVIIVASNGNAGPFDQSGSQPAAGENLIAVAAAAKSLDDGVREVSFYSSVGPDIDARFSIKRVRVKPDLTAIGGDVTTKPGNPDVYGDGVTSTKSKDMPKGYSDTKNGRGVRMSGTSMASPMVAGIALLVKLAIRLMGAETPFIKENLPLAVKAILMRTADDMGLPVWFQGAGLVNAGAAVALIAKTTGYGLQSRVAKLPGLSWAAPKSEADPWSWIASLKAVAELEDRAYEAAQLSQAESLARIEEDGGAVSTSAEDETGSKRDAGNAAQTKAVKAFNRSRGEALPALLGYLKDPVWLVRRNAAMVLLNLKTPGAAQALTDAALSDEDGRVRQAAFLALAELPGASVQYKGERWDDAIYAAYVRARHGDLAGVARIIQETSDKDKKARYSAVWLLGQLGDKVSEAEAEVLSAKTADLSERGNIRHIAAAALYNIVKNKPEALSDKALLDLLGAAGVQNLALTRTISKLFPEAVARAPLAERLKGEPLKTAVTSFVLKNKGSAIKPGALGEMVKLLAGHLSIPLDSPTAIPDPSGAGVEGVDPAMGPLDVIVERAEGPARLDPALLARFESELKAELPLSDSYWVKVPEHKLYAFSQKMLTLGYKLKLSQPQYNMARERAGDFGDPTVFNVMASDGGSSEASLMAALEAIAAKSDPLREPVIIVLGAGGAGPRTSPVNRLLNALVIRGFGVVVPAGNLGPAEKTLVSPANAGLPVVVAAPAEYSSRGHGISWADSGEGKRQGTAVAAERSALKLAALARRLSDALRARGRELPRGYFLYLAQLVKDSASAVAGSSPEATGAGLYDDERKVLAALEDRLGDLGAVEAESAALADKARLLFGKRASAMELSGPKAGSPAAPDWQKTKALKRALADGTGAVAPFSFKSPSGGWFKARSPGLEGFLYSKLELERAKNASLDQLEDYFRYLDALEGVDPVKAELALLRDSTRSPEEKNRRLDAILIDAVRQGQSRLRGMDPAQAGRQAQTYMIFSRAYNRLKPGQNFFDSLDDGEFARIRADNPGTTELWLMDIFEIGEIHRWGTGGGSSYSIKGYDRIKAELGGMEGYQRFQARARSAGFKVKVDFIPNHTSLDSDMVREIPEAFLHIVPPQPQAGESEAAYKERIMSGVPREPNGNHSPIFFLARSEKLGRWILIHHPRTDYGDVMWTDLAQIDYSRPEARRWQMRVLMKMFTEMDVDSVRRDMAYEIIAARFYPRWKAILNMEKNTASGWARQELERMIAGFEERANALKGAEFLEEATDLIKTAKPAATMVDEAYGQAAELSRSGSDGIYNKSDHDSSMGQIGLYDAMVSRDGGRIRLALGNAAFRRWQRGGAAMVNFIGTHDGGEGNPIDKLGRIYRAAAATALLMRPTLLYNGIEQGVGQKAQLLGDLSKSVDTEKAIPFDIPVKINWEAVNSEAQAFHKALLAMGERNRELLDLGAMQVLEPKSDSPIAAYSVGDGKKAVIVAANYSEGKSAAVFDLTSPMLKDFGAFEPRADRIYVLRDYANPINGRPAAYERSGKDLLENGLYVELAGGNAHLFEVEEINPNASIAGPPEIRLLSGAAKSEAVPASWDVWVGRLVYLALIPFFLLQAPQILANFHNLAVDPAKISILPWIGYATGILANSNLWGYHIDGKRTAVAFVQGAGVLTSSVVLAQIYMAGFMPAAAAISMAALIAASLAANILRWTGKLPEKLWNAWNGFSKLLGLFALPLGFSVTFNLMNTHPAAVLAASAALAALGAVAMALEKKGKLPKGLAGVWSTLGAWLGTLLFVFLPIPQIVNNFAHPENIKGLAIGTLLLSTLGNLLETTGAVNAKSQIWFVGSFWAVAVGGWGVLLSMVLFGAVSPLLFWSYTAAVPVYLGWMAHQVKTKHREKSYWRALKFIFMGDK